MAVVAVVGSTSWGVTIAALLARNSHDVRLICRTEEEVRAIASSRHAARTGDFELPAGITPALAEAARAAAALFVVVPSQSMRANARTLAPHLDDDAVVVHAAKGFERRTGLRMSEVLREELPQVPATRICALSGPNLAPEIRRGQPAAAVIAGSADACAQARALIHGAAFRVYVSDDLPGVELAGALKNVVALAAGIADGLGVGDNAKAAIITRGIAEMSRLGVALGARESTFAGLAGVGDVMATCYSPLSRNRRAGEAIGRGASIDEAIASAGGVVEGVEATAAACLLAERCGQEMPIAAALRQVLEGAPVAQAVRSLLEREPASER